MQAVLVACAATSADVPKLINYQGLLTNSSGTPLKVVGTITLD